ncbi:MAG: YihA family ribosome biogenesis GTP-binding protein [Clostridia bacterium]|nr:YihA family ribosome biogenesis GTP-binding protein [Clostridia bacterium]
MNIQNSNLAVTAGLKSQFPRDMRVQVAFSGRSNVGKSSLINTLLARKALARVSGQPGKTITINFYDVDKKLYLVDLPGYGFAKRAPADKEKWSRLTNDFFTGADKGVLKAVVQLIDIKVGPTADDDMMLEWLNGSGIPYIIAATKIDKLNRTDGERNLKLLEEYPLLKEGTPIIPFSSTKKLGRDDLWKCIIDHIEA